MKILEEGSTSGNNAIGIFWSLVIHYDDKYLRFARVFVFFATKHRDFFTRTQNHANVKSNKHSFSAMVLVVILFSVLPIAMKILATEHQIGQANVKSNKHSFSSMVLVAILFSVFSIAMKIG